MSDANDFARAMTWLGPTEGGFVVDSGGPTMRGVTQSVYDGYRLANGWPVQDVRRISDAEVNAIYRRQYWQPVAEGHAWPLSVVLFDCAVNCGVGNARRWNGLARAGTSNKTPNLATVIALKVIALRELYYRALAARPKYRPYLKGWLNRNANLRTLIREHPV